jgi:hypothetical protein
VAGDVWQAGPNAGFANAATFVIAGYTVSAVVARFTQSGTAVCMPGSFEHIPGTFGT